MELAFTIRPREPLLTPGEALCIETSIVNSTSSPVSVARFNASRGQWPRFTLTGPDGNSLIFGPAGHLQNGSEAQGDSQLEQVGPGQSYGEAVVIDAAFAQPGLYQLVAETAVFSDSPAERRSIATQAGIQVDQIHSIQVALARKRGLTEAIEVAAVRLIHGGGIHAVERRSFTDSGAGDGIIRTHSVVRAGNIGPHASSVVSFYSAESEAKPELDWIAWLEPEALCANVRCLGTRVLRFPLPPGRYAIMPPGLLSADGNFEVFVADLNEACIRLIRFVRPEAVVFPEPDFAALANQLPAEEDHADEEEDEEFDLYTATEPVGLWTTPLPCASSSLNLTGFAAAIAPAALGSGRRAVIVAQRSTGVAVHHLGCAEGKPPDEIGTAFLPGAMRLEADRPGVLVDGANNTRVALLVAVPNNQDGTKHLAVADLSFDAHGAVLIQDPVGLKDLGPLESDPIAAAASFWIGPDGSIRRDWIVQYRDGQAAFGIGDSISPRNSIGTPAVPLEILSLEHICAIAIVESNGQFRLQPIFPALQAPLLSS